ncbi:MAG: hypothetical protein Q9192_008314 [Flavoplaca navasiana]
MGLFLLFLSPHVVVVGTQEEVGEVNTGEVRGEELHLHFWTTMEVQDTDTDMDTDLKGERVVELVVDGHWATGMLLQYPEKTEVGEQAGQEDWHVRWTTVKDNCLEPSLEASAWWTAIALLNRVAAEDAVWAAGVGSGAGKRPEEVERAVYSCKLPRTRPWGRGTRARRGGMADAAFAATDVGSVDGSQDARGAYEGQMAGGNRLHPSTGFI